MDATDAGPSAIDRARRVGEAMFAADRASREFFEFELLSCTPGRATLRMTVRDEFLNGHGTCHGGILFAFADSTFGFACNSHNKNTVAAGCSIEFLRPARLGDVLVCEGVERALAGRHGVYDMTMTNQAGDIVALFRGKSAQIPGEIVPSL